MHTDTSTVKLSVQQIFHIDSNMEIDGFKDKSEFVPDIDESYYFNKDTTLAILAGFKYNKRVLVQGYHGTGKSTHIEQIAARLNWPCMRINLDGYINRIDLIGRDAIVVKDGLQITEFREGILPWAAKRPLALVLDEYDAGRPDVLFVLQRLLEAEGKLTLLEQNMVITPHPYFRIFATSNTIGLGDASGLYHGTNAINQGQMDRWNIVANLNYLPVADECQIILAKNPSYNTEEGKNIINSMVELANLTRNGFVAGDISCLMSPRTVINWAENNVIFGDLETSFRLTFYNKCDEAEKPIIAEYYQRAFNKDIEQAIPTN